MWSVWSTLVQRLVSGLRRYVGELRHVFLAANQPTFWCLQSECLEVRVNSVSTYSMYVCKIHRWRKVGWSRCWLIVFCIEVGSAQLGKMALKNTSKIKSAVTLGESNYLCPRPQNSFSFQLPWEFQYNCSPAFHVCRCFYLCWSFVPQRSPETNPTFVPRDSKLRTKSATSLERVTFQTIQLESKLLARLYMSKLLLFPKKSGVKGVSWNKWGNQKVVIGIGIWYEKATRKIYKSIMVFLVTMVILIIVLFLLRLLLYLIILVLIRICICRGGIVVIMISQLHIVVKFPNEENSLT